MTENFVLKGTICYTESPSLFKIANQGYLICEEGKSAGIFPVLPEKFHGLEVIDCGDSLIIPGLVDLHLHAPQYPFRGMGMDLDLLDWLKMRAFPEEEKYADTDYAKKAYKIFAEDLQKSATARACIFGTRHRRATELLMDQMEATGLISYVGKVSMDRNAPESLLEGTEESLREVETWLDEISGRYNRTMPILTPRFVPTCSDKLLEELGKISRRFRLPIQSHLSENKEEIKWVKKLCPWSAFYGDVYDRFGLFGGDTKTVMAHCVWSCEEEIQRMKDRGVFIAHCPESNMNLSSGIAPVRNFLDRGLRVGLGSDVAGGSCPSLFRAMRQAVQVSKLYRRIIDESCRPLSTSEVFYMATKGGGAFFGKVGSFEKGYDFDALVLDDKDQRHPQRLSARERLERLFYLTDEPKIKAKYVAGKSISLSGIVCGRP